MTASQRQVPPVPHTPQRVVWVEFEATLELLLGHLPIPVVPGVRRCQGIVGAGQTFIQFRRVSRCRLATRECLPAWDCAVRSGHYVGISQSRVSGSVIRVGLDCLLEMINRLLPSPARVLVEVVPPLEVRAVGFSVHGFCLTKRSYHRADL